MNKVLGVTPDMVECKSCKVMKKRFVDGSYDGKTKRYVDETYRHWNGKQCPDCKNAYVKQKMMLKRSSSESKD